ncbi:wsv113 [White spot syndrome virus]|uniref:Wsv113 n=4 Tax=White spot syndrome virus TaxID=342409 RepID=Q8VB74_WSSVS|nr:wsv113 [Shrimp white spot syndrome virus]AFX59490.1 wsv113 [White spot syndrome virus]AAL33117.1 wsv113 [Shrimp white spot syndrome virus]AAL89037.1 WSSV169 [Shrimp white spot syndrome virus]AWQ60301.1 wsv113 [Shrimp white spot syndrome virus]AWQ60716.1 wsv113 [Shrimp white spot syndrome virus]
MNISFSFFVSGFVLSFYVFSFYVSYSVHLHFLRISSPSIDVIRITQLAPVILMTSYSSDLIIPSF